MRPVKRQSATETKDVRGRLDLLLQLLSPWPDKPLTYERLATLIDVSESAIKSWAKRGSIPKEGAESIVRVAPRQGVSGVSLDWIQAGRGRDPSRRKRVSEVHSPPDVPPSDDGSAGIASAPVRVTQHEYESLSALAHRIAETVKLTLQHQELGHTQRSREIVALALEVFGRDLNKRCGMNVAGDIFDAALWLRNPENFPGA